MDVREKLVELLDEAEEWADHKCDELDCETCYAGKMKGNCVQKLMVDRLIYHGVTVQEWISVNDRLPTREDANETESILAINKDEKYVGRWVWDIVARWPTEFTCWMPIPQPPKGE